MRRRQRGRRGLSRARLRMAVREGARGVEGHVMVGAGNLRRARPTGSVLTMRSATSRSRIVLCSPRTTSVGEVIRGRSAQQSTGIRGLLARRDRSGSASGPTGAARRRRGRSCPQERRRGRGLRRAQPEAGERAPPGSESPVGGPRRPALERPEPLVVDVGARVDDDQAREAIRVPGGKRHGVVPAHRMPGDDDVLEAERARSRPARSAAKSSLR